MFIITNYFSFCPGVFGLGGVMHSNEGHVLVPSLSDSTLSVAVISSDPLFSSTNQK